MGFLFLAKQPLYGDEVSIMEALLISLVAIVIVFAILFLIVGIISLMQKVFFSKKKEEAVEENEVNEVPQKPINSMVEITDEDMMVAALIATIDYTNETKKDVRLLSIKQIG